MSTQEQLIELEKKIVQGNYDLLNLVPTLPPSDQKVYSEKVSRLIERTQATVSGLNKKVELQLH